MFRMKQHQQKSRTLMPLPGVFEGLSRQRLRDAFKRRRSAVQLCSQQHPSGFARSGGRRGGAEGVRAGQLWLRSLMASLLPS